MLMDQFSAIVELLSLVDILDVYCTKHLAGKSCRGTIFESEHLFPQNLRTDSSVLQSNVNCYSRCECSTKRKVQVLSTSSYVQLNSMIAEECVC